MAGSRYAFHCSRASLFVIASLTFYTYYIKAQDESQELFSGILVPDWKPRQGKSPDICRPTGVVPLPESCTSHGSPDPIGLVCSYSSFMLSPSFCTYYSKFLLSCLGHKYARLLEGLGKELLAGIVCPVIVLAPVLVDEPVPSEGFDEFVDDILCLAPL